MIHAIRCFLNKSHHCFHLICWSWRFAILCRFIILCMVVVVTWLPVGDDPVTGYLCGVTAATMIMLLLTYWSEN